MKFDGLIEASFWLDGLMEMLQGLDGLVEICAGQIGVTGQLGRAVETMF